MLQEGEKEVDYMVKAATALTLMKGLRDTARALMPHPSKQDLLRAAALRRRPGTLARMLPITGGFAAGMLVGVGTALMLAPTSGAELRRSLRDTLSRIGARHREPEVTSVVAPEDEEKREEHVARGDGATSRS